MYQRKKTLNEEISRIRNLLGFEHSNVILEQEENFEEFKFAESYPDNIAFPIIKNANITTVNDVLRFLNPKLTRFIDSLNNKLKENPNIGKIIIKSGASPEGANTNVPDGFDPKIFQSVVNYSFSNNNGNKTGDAFGKPIKMLVDNTTLKINRANFMKWILQSKIPQLTDDMFEINTDLTEKAVNVLIPTSLGVVNIPELLKQFEKENKEGEPFTNTEKESVTIGCDTNGNGNGNVGLKENGYVADRIKLNVGDYNGTVTLQYNALDVPDRFIVRQKASGEPYSSNDKVVVDTRFVSNASGELRTNLLYALKNILGSNIELSGSKGYGIKTFNAEPGFEYYVDVIAPLGGTYWTASLQCKAPEAKVSFEPDPQLDPKGKKTINTGSGKHTIYIGTDGLFYDENFYKTTNDEIKGKLKIYMSGDFTANGSLKAGYHCVREPNNAKGKITKVDKWVNGNTSSIKRLVPTEDEKNSCT